MAWMLRKQRVTLTLQKGQERLDFDNQAQSWGITMKIQKTMKLKFGLFNRNFFLAQRYKDRLMDDVSKEKRRALLSQQ
jgi:hypothetical protein